MKQVPIIIIKIVYLLSFIYASKQMTLDQLKRNNDKTIIDIIFDNMSKLTLQSKDTMEILHFLKNWIILLFFIISISFVVMVVDQGSFPDISQDNIKAFLTASLKALLTMFFIMIIYYLNFRLFNSEESTKKMFSKNMKFLWYAHISLAYFLIVFSGLSLILNYQKKNEFFMFMKELYTNVSSISNTSGFIEYILRIFVCYFVLIFIFTTFAILDNITRIKNKTDDVLSIFTNISDKETEVYHFKTRFVFIFIMVLYFVFYDVKQKT